MQLIRTSTAPSPGSAPARPGLAALALALIPAAWLLPNHYLPWLSAWQDGFAIAALLVAALLCRGGAALSWPWAAALALALLSVLVQTLDGTMLFAGDAWVVALYLLAFALAMQLGGGTGFADIAGTGRSASGETWALGVLAAASVSVGIGLVQWTGAVELVVFMAELPPGGRPFANVAQPNHLCSVAFLGLCALAQLHQGGRLGVTGLLVGSAWLVFGMAMTGSRTGWLQLGALTLLLLWFRPRAGLRAGLAWLVGLWLLFAALHRTWPLLNDALLLSGARSDAVSLGGDARPPLWRLLVAALADRPWTGYGWQQVVVAQQELALAVPPVQRHFEHAHNLVLDLLVWAGLPVGGLIVLLLGWGLLRCVRRCRDADAAWWLIALAGLGAHAMVELPHAIAYFLIPAGLMMGAVAQRCGLAGMVWPRAAVLATAATTLLMLVPAARDYLHAEENFRTFRLEAAGVGIDRAASKAPELWVLTQLEAFLRFVRTPARSGLSDAELDALRRASLRFAYPPSMLRYALAAGLNGRSEEAGTTLRRLCAIHRPERCDEGRVSWDGLRFQHPVLERVSTPWGATP